MIIIYNENMIENIFTIFSHVTCKKVVYDRKLANKPYKNIIFLLDHAV